MVVKTVNILPMGNKCPNCGAALKNKNAKVCPKCGHIIVRPVS